MKKAMVFVLALTFVMGMTAFAQDTMAPAPADKAAAAPLMTLKGTVKADGDKYSFVNDKDGKSWDVINPETLKGHEPLRHRHFSGVELRARCSLVEHLGYCERARGRGQVRARVERFSQAGQHAFEPAIQQPRLNDQSLRNVQRAPVARRFGRVVARPGFEQQARDAVVLAGRFHPHDRRFVEHASADGSGGRSKRSKTH